VTRPRGRPETATAAVQGDDFEGRERIAGMPGEAGSIERSVRVAGRKRGEPHGRQRAENARAVPKEKAVEALGKREDGTRVSVGMLTPKGVDVASAADVPGSGLRSEWTTEGRSLDKPKRGSSIVPVARRSPTEKEERLARRSGRAAGSGRVG